MSVRGWMAGVDWSGDGNFTGPLEDVSSYVNKEPIVVTWGRPTGSLDTATPSSQFDFQLRNRDLNWDRWFSPENQASPIAGKILNGRQVRLEKTVRGAGTLYAETAFTTALGGWSAVSGGTLTRVASPSEDGDGALNYVPPGAVATVGVTRAATIDITALPASTYLLSIRVRASSAFTDAQAVIDWYDKAGTLLSSSAGLTTALTSGTWITVQTAYVALPDLAVGMRPRLRLGSTPPNTTTFNVDSASIIMLPDDAGKTYRLFDGPLDDHSVDSLAVARTFSGTALDGWGAEDTTPLSTIVYTGIRTGEAINVVLDEAGWTGGRNIDAGATVIGWWCEEGTSPGEAVDRLVAAEGTPAIAYVAGGVFHFHDRHHRAFDDRSLTSQGTFTHLLPGSVNATGVDFKIEKGTFGYDHGLKSIVNATAFSVNVVRPAVLQEVWAQEDPVTMLSGDTLTVFAESNDPVINVQPIDDTDIQAMSGLFTATVDRSSGRKFAVTITCVNSGTLTRVGLRGAPVVTARTVQVSATDAGSVGRYRRQTWPGEIPWANPYDVQAIADRIVAANAEYRPRITFTVPVFNDRYASKLLSLQISDRITVVNEVIGVAGDFFIEQLTHTVERLQMHRVTIACIAAPPEQPANALMFNVAGRGFNDGSFALTGIDNATTALRFDVGGQGFEQGQFAS